MATGPRVPRARASTRIVTPAAGPTTRPRVVLTVGKLDGVHAGHRHLVAHVEERADEAGALSAAIVLHPDPVAVLTSARVPRLTTVDDRCARLRAFGVEIVEPLRFTTDIAALAPDVFIDRLEDRFDIAGLVVGPDFAFGRGRSGDLSRLTALAADRGFELATVTPIQAVGEWISSRRLRSLIADGDIGLARTLLRCPPRVVGTVIHGAARGRELGFPTANLDLTADFVLPADGIYTVRAQWREHPRAPRSRADGVASVGVRPTFDNGARLVEVHLLDFEGDLYGTDMTVDFLYRQRPEERFDSIDALVDQMREDVRLARRSLRAEARPRWESVDEGGGGDPAVVRLRGLDLADLCQSAADALLGAAPSGPRPCGSTATPSTGDIARHTVSLSAPTDEALLQAWLDLITAGADDTGGAASSEAGAPAGASGIVAANVYFAGAGRLYALVARGARPTAAGGAGRAGPLAEGAAVIRLHSDPLGGLVSDVTPPAGARVSRPT
ncbi:MAG: riboflavin biosynthesis protein RibF [Anaerolineae bacterium]